MDLSSKIRKFLENMVGTKYISNQFIGVATAVKI